MIATCPRCGFDTEALHAIEVGELRIDYDGAIILWRGQRVNISPCERLMVLALARADGAPIKRCVLAETMGYEGEAADNNTAVHLHRINARFREIDPAFDRIENIRGEGVRWRTQ